MQNNDLVTQLYSILGSMELSLGIINEAILWIDNTGTIGWCNSVFDKLINHEHIEILGKNIIDLLPLRSQNEMHVWVKNSENNMTSLNPPSGIYEYAAKEGMLFLEINSKFISLIAGTTLVVVIRDITEQHKLQLHLQHTAHHDLLTKLPNRLSMEERLHAEFSMAKRHNKKFAILMLDIDGFKAINDNLGHVLGDILLKNISLRFRSNLRAEDFVARVGGDEFMIIISNVHDIHDVGAGADRIINMFKEPFDLAGHFITITVSIGIALYPEDGSNISTLVKNSDAALYRAKNLGRNNYQYYTEEINTTHAYYLKLLKELRFVIEKQQLFLVYQPRFEIATNKIVGIEVFLRWRHPELGIISPVEFIPIAEKSGLIGPIGEWVLKKACEQYQKWFPEESDCILSINISPYQFMKNDFIKKLRTILKDTKIPPARLELELNEDVIINYLASSKEMLLNLHRMGVHVSIDNFGSDYSSLKQINNFLIRNLMIDQSFLHDTVFNSTKSPIVKAVVDLSKALGFTPIQEGVETEQDLQSLVNSGCAHAQGYYFSKPLDEKEMFNLLKESP